MKTFCKTIVRALPALLILFLLSACGGDAISWRDYITVSFSGADGYGTASLQYGTLEEDLWSRVEGASDQLDVSAYLLETVVTVDPKEGLSNGDSVTVTVDYPEGLEDLAGPFRDSSWTVQVEDLPEVESRDLFAEDITVTFSGANGYGVAEATVNSAYDLTATCLSGSGLSNGDEVTVSLTAPNSADVQQYCIDNYGFVPQATEQTFTVSGLEELGTIDLFEGIVITADGTNTRGTITLSGGYEELIYLPSESTGLTNGDVITITVTRSSFGDEEELMEYCAEQFGAVPESTTMEYTVEGLDAYITELDQIPDDLMSQMQETAEADLTSRWDSKGAPYQLNSYEYVGRYLLTTKDPSDFWNSHNRLYLIYSINTTNAHVR